MTTDPSEPPARSYSLILRVIGILFLILGAVWLPAAIDQAGAGTLKTFEGARAWAYAATYLAAGVGMTVHARWAAYAVAAWGLVAFTQLFHPPIPRDRVPLAGQIALALIALFWMLGLFFFVLRKTRS